MTTTEFTSKHPVVDLDLRNLYFELLAFYRVFEITQRKLADQQNATRIDPLRALVPPSQLLDLRSAVESVGSLLSHYFVRYQGGRGDSGNSRITEICPRVGNKIIRPSAEQFCCETRGVSC